MSWACRAGSGFRTLVACAAGWPGLSPEVVIRSRLATAVAAPNDEGESYGLAVANNFLLAAEIRNSKKKFFSYWHQADTDHAISLAALQQLVEFDALLGTLSERKCSARAGHQPVRQPARSNSACGTAPCQFARIHRTHPQRRKKIPPDSQLSGKVGKYFPPPLLNIHIPQTGATTGLAQKNQSKVETAFSWTVACPQPPAAGQRQPSSLAPTAHKARNPEETHMPFALPPNLAQRRPLPAAPHTICCGEF